MPASKSPARKPRWFMIPVRVVLVTFLLSLLTFAVTLLLGILGIVLGARARGVHPDWPWLISVSPCLQLELSEPLC